MGGQKKADSSLDKSRVINKSSAASPIVLKDIRKPENLFRSVNTWRKNKCKRMILNAFNKMVIFPSFRSKSADDSGLAHFTQGFPQSYPQVLWKTEKAMF